MEKPIANLLNKEQVCVLSVLLQNGDIHSATVHYSHKDAPLKFYIQTSNDTLKAQPFLKGEAGKAAMVIGFSEQDWLTLQMHGNVRIITNEDELQDVYKIHYKKHPGAEKYKGPQTVTLEFTSTWWRYTDYNTEPETIITS